MISTNNGLEPIFPPELEQIIFKMAFNPEDISTNGKMMLVAKRIRYWIRPLVYRICDLRGLTWYTGRPPFPNFAKMPDGVEIGEICKFVTHLSVDETRSEKPEPGAKSLIEQCPNLENLACWGDSCLVDVWDSISTLKRLKRLSGQFVDITHTNLEGEVFQSLTHVEVLYEHSPHRIILLHGLTALKSLTHLILNIDPNDDEYCQNLQAMMSSWEQIQIFILCPLSVLSEREELPMELITVYSQDARVAIVDQLMNNADDWRRGVWGEPDVWYHASNIVFARKHGFFKSNEYTRQPVTKTFPWLKYLTEEGRDWYRSL